MQREMRREVQQRATLVGIIGIVVDIRQELEEIEMIAWNRRPAWTTLEGEFQWKSEIEHTSFEDACKERKGNVTWVITHLIGKAGVSDVRRRSAGYSQKMLSCNNAKRARVASVVTLLIDWRVKVRRLLWARLWWFSREIDGLNRVKDMWEECECVHWSDDESGVNTGAVV